MKIQIISLFPGMLEPFVASGMMRKATEERIVEFVLTDLRKFGIGDRRTVDSIPYGGGDGMVLRPEPLFAAIEDAKKADPDALVVMPTPRGDLYEQADAQNLADNAKGLILICPRYEGYDERVASIVDKQFCIGKYILTGGEIPAMVIVDSVVRLLPGVLGGEFSLATESFNDSKMVEYPQYTRPEDFRGMKVPGVLLSGHHAEIEKWRDSQSKLL